MRKSAKILLSLLLASALFTACTCGGGEPAEPIAPPPEESPTTATTPKLIAPNAPSPTPTEANEVEEPFSVDIHHAVLFDPRTGPINQRYSDETGVHLLVSGTIRNHTGRLIHRAAIFATLIATFKEKTELERHSGGLGFSPRVTSLDPWRPEEERVFTCITRPLDPIYFELVPEKLMAAITVQARDPLQYRFRNEVAKLQVGWESIFGAVSSDTATITVDGPFFAAPQQRRHELTRGQSVKVLYQRGLAFKVMDDKGRLGWIGYDRLHLHETHVEAETEEANHRFPIRMELANGLLLQVIRVAEFEMHEGVRTDKKIYRVEMKFFNNGEKNIRTPAESAFALDAAGGGYERPLRVKQGTKGIYKQTTIKPGENSSGALLFEHETGSFPFDLEIHSNGNSPIRIPLFPALLAVQNNRLD